MRRLIKGELPATALRALGATPREVRTLCAWANQQAWRHCGKLPRRPRSSGFTVPAQLTIAPWCAKQAHDYPLFKLRHGVAPLKPAVPRPRAREPTWLPLPLFGGGGRDGALHHLHGPAVK